MRRRAFIALFGGAAAWPLRLSAQQATSLPVIGVLHSGSAQPNAHNVATLREGLSEIGLIEGKHFSIEFRWANGNYDRLPEMARDLVARNVAVIVAGGGIASAPAAKSPTATIPIVFIYAGDPIAAGLVTSLARPEANVTGVSFLSQFLGAKRLSFLSMLAPDASSIAVLMNPANPARRAAAEEINDAAGATKRTIRIFDASTEEQIDSAFATIMREQFRAILVHTDPLFTSQRVRIAVLASKAAVPAIYPSRDYAEAGGLASYGANTREEYRKAGVYAGRLLHGAKPADLPILQPTKFELLINLRTARSIGLTIPDAVQLLADEVIE